MISWRLVTSHILVLAIVIAHPGHGKPLRTVCYFPNWAQYKGYRVDRVDPHLCTHINFAFAHITDTKLIHVEPNDIATYKALNDLKSVNPALKTLLSIGGYSMGSAPFLHVSSTPALRAEFAKNVVQYLNAHGFDGADIDWEYPEVYQREQYTSLMKALHSQFRVDDGRPLILTAAFGAGKVNHYDLENVHPFVDFSNLMTYDFHGYWGTETRTGLHSALYGITDTDRLSQVRVVSDYISAGLPREKLVLGIPTYGRSFQLADSSDTRVGARATGPGDPGDFTAEPGILAYNEICRRILTAGYTRDYDDKQQTPYAHHGNQWIGYDDVQSVTEKLKYVETNSLGGVMFWDMSKDDYEDQCGGGNYPLINLARPEDDASDGDTIKARTLYVLCLVCGLYFI